MTRQEDATRTITITTPVLGALFLPRWCRSKAVAEQDGVSVTAYAVGEAAAYRAAETDLEAELKKREAA